MVGTQVETKFIRQQEKYSLAEELGTSLKKELG